MKLPDLDGIIPISAMTDWSDEQWAEHDARVAAERERENALPVRAPVDLRSYGWPALALREARTCDTSKPAVARLLGNDFATTHIVVLSGSKGTGKTVAAARWAQGFGRCARFVRAATFAASSRYDAEQRALWYDADALVLDDLGAEYLDTKGSFLVDLDELIDTYYADLRPLVVTTNCSNVQFQERYGARIWDRLKQCAKWFSVGGDSMRKAAP